MKFYIFKYSDRVYIGILGQGPTLLGIYSDGLLKANNVFYFKSDKFPDKDKNDHIKIIGMDLVE